MNLPLIEDHAERDPLRRTYELARVAEEAGFYGGFIGHHHFTPGYPTAPWVVLAAIAARTESLMLGTSIFLLPVHHPIAVAEQVATLDGISNGRAILGVGIGYRPYEYEAFDVQFRRRGSRMTESLEVIKAAWTEEKMNYDGRHFYVSDVPVLPKPVQQPHPPIWVGAVARQAQQRAATHGDVWLSDLMEPMPREQHLAERYRRFCAEAGRAPSVCIMRTAAVARRREDLEEHWLPGVVDMQLDYWRAGAQGRDDDGVFARLQAGDAVTLPEFARDRVIAGTPDDCIAELRRWQEAVAPDYLLIGLGGPERGYEATRVAFERFGREVLPALH